MGLSPENNNNLTNLNELVSEVIQGISLKFLPPAAAAELENYMAYTKP